MAEPGADAAAPHDQQPSSAGEARTSSSPTATAGSKRRLDRIFGDVLPEVTRDDLAGDIDEAGRSDEATGTARDAAGRDADLLRDVPPHHHP